MNFLKHLLIVIALCFYTLPGRAQEYAVPLDDNALTRSGVAAQQALQKPTALALPFFEDFTDAGHAPTPARWQDSLVFVNNTMAVNSRSRGCATFDALNQYGIPYDSIAPYHQVLADSLTSKPIDLSGYQPADSIYLSFLYQPGGAGFPPKPADSLLVYFLRSDGGWEQVWRAAGDTSRDFQTAMIAVTDTSFLHAGFQFRLLNKATHGVSNSNWNVDYIRMDQNRNYVDSLFQDIAYTRPPGNLLADFTAMPFRQFAEDPASFLRPEVSAWLRNNGPMSTSLQFGCTTRELTTGTNIGSYTGTDFFPANETDSFMVPTPGIGGFQPTDPSAAYVFRTKYYVMPVYPDEPVANDTIIQDQVFDNYFAYDDGSAEQAYFLHLFPSAPGRVAEEFALYTPDTLRGVAVFFPRQVPTATHKEFSIVVYKTIAINGAQDQILYQEDYLTPRYSNTPGGFVTYAFEEPVPLPDGVFYIAIVQAAGGSSDSLYIGLDVSRRGANHRYYNVNGTWQNSLIDGALLLRPLVGAPLPPSGIREFPTDPDWSFFPNPAQNTIRLSLPGKASVRYQIVDLRGRVVHSGRVADGGSLSIQSLPSGMYFIRLQTASGFSKPQKLVKW